MAAMAEKLPLLVGVELELVRIFEFNPIKLFSSRVRHIDLRGWIQVHPKCDDSQVVAGFAALFMPEFTEELHYNSTVPGFASSS